MRTDDKTFDLFVYGGFDYLFPEVGLALRTYARQVGWEGNIAIFPLYYRVPSLKTSTSLLFYSGEIHGNKFYSGIGLGVAWLINIGTSGKSIPLFYFPLFVGLQKGHFVMDVGCDAVIFQEEIFPVPTGRIGIQF